MGDWSKEDMEILSLEFAEYVMSHSKGRYGDAGWGPHGRTIGLGQAIETIHEMINERVSKQAEAERS